MYCSSLFLTAALVGTTVALVQPAASAKSASEVESIARIARAVTVEINFKLRTADRRIEDIGGSGVIVHRKGDLYTLVTNRHVVCGRGQCSQLPLVESYNLSLADGQRYQVKKSSIKFLGNDLDLAIIQFRSGRNYSVAKIATSRSLRIKDNVYTAGFPAEQPGLAFGEGKVVAVVNKRLEGNSGGYTIIYDAATLPGMSGGGVFDSSGQLVAIHGQGSQYQGNTDLNNNYKVGSKIGYNRGIPIRWLVQNLAEVGINLGTDRSISGIKVARSQVPTTADEYFIMGFNKFIEPGDNVIAGKQQAIQYLSTSIRLNPKYQHAYLMRAWAYYQIDKFEQSLADYNQAIIIDPKYYAAYNNRAILKADKLNDTQGALADYDQAIIIDPKSAAAYDNRASLKAGKLNDIRGALADYDQAIALNPKYSNAYYNRASLKAGELNDIRGALTDYDQAITLNPRDSAAYINRGVLKAEKLKDIQGALADYNQVIALNPRDSDVSYAYYNRANLKAINLNDIKGALADYDQAITLNPKYSIAYFNRGVLKAYKLGDKAGAIQDFRQAAKLFREQGRIQDSQRAINALRQLGTTE
jgi:tetratricopeptide (TPR) repeat protein